METGYILLAFAIIVAVALKYMSAKTSSGKAIAAYAVKHGLRPVGSPDVELRKQIDPEGRLL